MTHSIINKSKLFLGLAFFLLGLGGIFWFVLSASLPQYSGSAKLSSLTQAVRVDRDALGTATIQAMNRLDLTQALGYVHAQERFFEMDLMRRSAAGELAELFGKAALPKDRQIRKHRMRTRAKHMFDNLPEDQRALIESYRKGVNAGLATLLIQSFPYLLIRERPVPWQNEDTLLVILAMYFTLQESSLNRELQLSALQTVLPASVYQFLTASGGDWDAPLIGIPLKWPQLPSKEEFNFQAYAHLPTMEQDRLELHDEAPGSNSFAVSGSLTDGAALIANDMHLTLRVPNIWFRTRLIYPHPNKAGINVAVSGVTLPGVPAIVVGSNGNVAWSFTNSYIDVADWVRVVRHPEHSTRYLSDGDWKSLATFQEILHVRDAEDEFLEVEETEWGPILGHDHDGTALALKWVAQHRDAADLKLMRLEWVETAHQALEIAQQSGIPAQNFIVGDREGSIGWTIAGRIPMRSGNYDPNFPSDWPNGETGWLGWLPSAHYPLISNPMNMRLWSANARMIDGLALVKLGDGGYELGARSKQIRDNLFAKEKFTALDLFEVQLDHRALFLSRWQKLLHEVIDHAPIEPWKQKLEDGLLDWDGLAVPSSVSYRIVRTFRQEVVDSIYRNFIAVVKHQYPDFSPPRLPQIEHAIWRLIENRPPHLLPLGNANWEAFLQKCARKVALLMETQSGDDKPWNWGGQNTAQIQHPLSKVLPNFVAWWLNMPKDLLPGDSFMPRIQAPSFGASERFVVAPGNEEQGYFSMPGGQSGHPLSPYYGSGHQDWVSGKPSSFLPGIAQQTLWLAPH
ncbi:MAG TPA: penicillin acylase family protein [Nitrosomonas sp.]|nr:penicillin acylase family protein [Nitrosomonas sp.]